MMLLEGSYTQIPIILNSHLHVWKSSKSTKERHGFTRARRATKHQGFMLSEPGVQQTLMAHSVNSWNNKVSCSHFMSFNFHLGNLGLPWHPLTCWRHLYENLVNSLTTVTTIMKQIMCKIIWVWVSGEIKVVFF